MSVTIATGSSVDLPIASVIWYAAAYAPDTADHVYIPTGFLYCNGAVLKQVDYQELYNKIKGIYNIIKTGTTDVILDENNKEYSTSTYFTIPDLRDRFIKGYSNKEGSDPLGTYQNDSIGKHTHNLETITGMSLTGTADSHRHNISFGTGTVNYSSSGNLTVLTSIGGTNTTTKSTSNITNLNINIPIEKSIYDISETGFTETRPKNINFIPIIKY